MSEAPAFAPVQRTSSRFAARIRAHADAADMAFNPSGRGKVFWTSTARSALRAVLLHLRSTGALPDAHAEILVPRWACTSLYNSINKVCFPTIQDTPSLRGVLVYHQYGFPQRLDVIAQRCRDRGMFLLENSVNCVFDGPSVGGIGEFGTANIFSLPKMFRTNLGGALVARDPALEVFCAEYFRGEERWIGRLSGIARRLTSTRLHEMAYALTDYGRNAHPGDLSTLRHEIASGAIMRRKENYLRLRREFSETPFFDGLEPEAIPYVVPLFGPRVFLDRLSAHLAERGWESGVYHFDAARDLFAPRFVPCVPLPTHHEVGPAWMDELIGIIRRLWRLHG